MKLVRALVAGLALAAVATAADEKKPAKFDPEALVGKWKITGGFKDGEKLEKPSFDMTITKDKITMKGDDGMEFEFGYKIDAKADPVAVDFEIKAPEAFKGATAKGIVWVEKDAAKIAYHPMQGERPKNFDGKKGTGEHSFEMKKADKEEKK